MVLSVSGGLVPGRVLRGRGVEVSFDGNSLILVRARERTRTVIPLGAVSGVDRPDDRLVRLVIRATVVGGAPEYPIPVRGRARGETFARALTASLSAGTTVTGRPTIREVADAPDATALARRRFGRQLGLWATGYFAVIALLFVVADGEDADMLFGGTFMGPMGVGLLGGVWLAVGDSWKLLLRGIRVPGKVVGEESFSRHRHPVLAFTTRDGHSRQARDCHPGTLAYGTLLDVRYDSRHPQRVSHKRSWGNLVGSVIALAGGLAFTAVLVVPVTLILLDLAGFR